MADYRLVFRDSSTANAVRSISFSGENPSDALAIAQRYEGPAELWSNDGFICTLRHSGHESPLWTISGDTIAPRR